MVKNDYNNQQYLPEDTPIGGLVDDGPYYGKTSATLLSDMARLSYAFNEVCKLKERENLENKLW